MIGGSKEEIDTESSPSESTASCCAEPLLSIGKVAKQYKVSLRTLRFYENNNLLHPCHRGTTRLYRARDCHRLEMILYGKQLGFSLADIRELLHPVEDETEVLSIEAKLSSAKMLSTIKSLEQRRGTLDRIISDLREKLNR